MARTLNIASWNLKHLRAAKTEDRVFNYFWNEFQKTQAFDIMIALEVNINGGAAAVEAMKSMKWGTDNPWGGFISDKNAEAGGDKYAVLFNEKFFKHIGYELLTDFVGRAPARFTFQIKHNEIMSSFDIIAYHAPNPRYQSTIIENMNKFEGIKLDKPTILLGDFNLEAKSYEKVLQNSSNWKGPAIDPKANDAATTLKRAGIPSWEKNITYANPYDNAFWHNHDGQGEIVKEGRRFDFTPSVINNLVDLWYGKDPLRLACDSLLAFRKHTSDHLPIIVKTNLRPEPLNNRRW